MVCKFYYSGGYDHKCSLINRYGDKISDKQYSNCCKYNGHSCEILKKNKNKTNSNSYNPNNKSSGSNCFITTIVCDILGNDIQNKIDELFQLSKRENTHIIKQLAGFIKEKDDIDMLLNNFRGFRDNVLQNDSKYDDVLMSYDTVGPVISNCIINDDNRIDMARGLYENALIRINKLIKCEQYDEACEAYYIMTLFLINYYRLKHPYNQLVDNNYGYIEDEFDRKTAGHGKRKVLVINNKNNISEE
ncbi:MAG: hypothetical protein IKF19_04075 [Bacilli bacterium]|nr:hypothetical protein [Bacilli bacterium]